MNIGFTNYTETKPVKPNTRDILDELTSNQKVAILNGFAMKKNPSRLRREIFLSNDIILYLYGKIDEIEERARVLMRGEVLITPEERNPETGEVITPAVYNTPPTSQTALKNTIASDFEEDFDATQVGAILSKMIKYSNGGSGTWTFYKTEVVK